MASPKRRSSAWLALERRRRRKATVAKRDPTATCTIRFYLGAGIPQSIREGRYRGLPTSFDRAKFERRVERAISKVFPNATFLRTRGVWKGGSEDGLMVEVLASPVRGSCDRVIRRARVVAGKLARSLGQEAVLLTVTDASGRRSIDLVPGLGRAA